MEFKKAVNWGIKNVIKEGLTDIFDRPFEIDMLQKNKIFQEKIFKDTLKCLESKSFAGLQVSSIDSVLLPKNSAFSFRKCALIQPHDTIKYLSLVLTIADQIEQARIPIAKKKVFSYRFKLNNGFLFNKNYTITSFREYIAKQSKRQNTKIVVSCDIANFYERLNLHRLENNLLSIGCERNTVNVINRLLMFWSNNDSYGLPVGSNASRILSEASLIGVDNYLMSMEIDFIRFVDDYRFFAPDAQTAHYWLTLLIDRLGQEGLSINMSKTKIESVNDISIMKTSENKKSHGSSESDKNPFVIRAGYGGTVPTRFRNLSNKEKSKLVSLNVSQMFSEFEKKSIVEANEFTRLIKACVAQESFSQIIDMIPLIDKYLQLTPYYIDVLIKYSSFFSKSEVEAIRNYFLNKIKSNKPLPEFLAIAYIRLFGHETFANKSTLIDYFRNLKRDSGSYIGRAVLDSLYGLVNREDVLEIRKSFSHSDLWEKRQIVKIITRALENEEKKAWLRNIRHTESNELFLIETIEPSKRKKRK